MKQLLFLLFIVIASNSYAQTSKVEWIKRIGDSGTDYTGTIATDVQGNVYVASGFIGQLIFNTDTLNSPSISEPGIFLAKYDSLGNALWGKTLPYTNFTSFQLAGVVIKKILVSPNGRIYTIGHLDYNGLTYAYISINRSDGSQVIYYSNIQNGNHLDIDVDSIDNSYLVGHMGATGYSTYIFKLDSIGAVKWGYFSPNQDVRVNNVRYANGIAYIAGQFRYQYTLADTVGSGPITLNATNGINDYDFYIAQYSKDGKILSGQKEDGVVTGAGGPFEFSSDFAKNGNWNITWGNSTGGIHFKQYTSSLSIAYNFVFPITTPCPFQAGAITKCSRFNDEGVFSYSGLACPPFKNYVYDSAGLIQDTITNPHTGTIMSYTPSRDLTLGKSGNMFIISEFTGTLTYYDSIGSKTLSSVAGSQDLFVAKFHKCAEYTPAIIQNGDTLTCSIPGMNYQWYLNGNPVSGNSQTLVITASGNYTVSIIDNWNCSNISTPINATVGIVHISNSKIAVFPNPVTSILTVNGIENNTSITITDITGRIVVAQIANQGATIDVSSLPSGIYLLRIDEKVTRIIKD